MTTELNTDTPVLRHPVVRTPRFGRFEPSDWVWTGIVGIIGILISSIVFDGQIFALILVPFIVIWALTMRVSKDPRFNERLYLVPITTINDLDVTYRKKGIIWKQTTDKKQFAKRNPKRKRSRTPFPLEVRVFDKVGLRDIGLIYNQEKRTLSMVFKGDGSDVGSMSRLEQYYWLKRFSKMITKAAAIAGIRGLRMSVGIRNRPQDQWLIPETMLEVGDIDAILPKAIALNLPKSEYLDTDETDVLLHEFMNDFAEITVQTYDVDMLVVLTVKENAALRRAAQKVEIKERDLKRLPIMRIKNVIQPILERLIGEVEILGEEGAERHLRKARDVATLYDYYEAAHDEVVRKREGVEVDIVYDRYLPEKNITVYKDCLNVDGTWAAVLDMTTFPADEVYAHDAASLYDTEARFSSFSIIGETFHSGREYTTKNIGNNVKSDIADFIGVIRSGPKARRKEAESEERLAEMDEAVFNQDFVIRYAVLSGSKDDLEEDIDLDIDHFSGQSLGPHRFSNPSKQWRRFLTTVTLIDCE